MNPGKIQYYRFNHIINFTSEKDIPYFINEYGFKTNIDIFGTQIAYALRVDKTEDLSPILSFKAVPNDLKNLIVVFKFRNLEYEHRVVLH